MLTESFIVSTSSLEKSSNANSSKDIGIHFYDFQPQPPLKSSFKKSSTQQNCLAVSPSHVFAAQAEKSVVHIYDRAKGTQEAVVPFPERIRSIALAGVVNGATLVLGTEGGRVILWELCTGRQVSTPQSHLQPTTCLAVDPTSNFLLSGSPDSNIHLWSIPSLLSFQASVTNDPSQPLPFSPLNSLSNHRAPINALAFGHSSSTSNIAVSASADKTCIVWDYIAGSVLHTYLLPSTPLCLALDPADRAVYAGYEDGSVQLVNFYAQHSINHPLYNPTLQATPTQPPTSDHWHWPGEKSSASLAIQLSYDGTTLLSGHQNGVIQTWDVAKGRPKAELADLTTPITNLIMLPPTGFPNLTPNPLKLHKVIKPRYETSLNGNNNLSSSIPANYTFTAQFASTLPLPSSPSPSPFHQSLSSPTFPSSLLSPPINPTNPIASDSDLATQNTHLFSQLTTALENQRSAMKEVLKLDRERYEWMEAERIKKDKKRERRLRRREMEDRNRMAEMGEAKAEMAEGQEEEGISSSTDEMTDTE